MSRSRSIAVWPRSPTRARQIQLELAARVRREPLRSTPRRIAGLDAALSTDGLDVIGVAVIWDLHDQCLLEQAAARRRLRFPYIPGLLSFREAPALLAALDKVRHSPDLLLCDGQGVAHPRRFGLACHLGVLCDLPAIGCAKSRLIGQATDPPPEPGAWSLLLDNDEIVGAVVRTRAGSRPVYVSVGHRCTLDDAIRVVLSCCGGHRLPEPTYWADRLSRRLRAGS
ncbi:endonuclease V [Limisphaera ngatamarikiensis]|uniref:Endonuclease V n=1 Tax=Limisphaera ngatamarikiensis TaxID=1324935 RepID=A0A6M1RKG5_9BACT|nr:deoxyribonuclease V [Limisphaera ngatamarikiensis]NGO38089.1 endonuclease V [Limisphaera ngatamarikiensis]